MPEKGASIAVAWLLSKSTMPVVSTLLWKGPDTTGVSVMLRSCSSVSVMLLPPLAGAFSDLPHPARHSAESAIGTRKLLRIGFSKIGAMPPATAQRLKQRSGIGIAAGLCLQERDMRLLIGLFGLQKGEAVVVAVFQLIPVISSVALAASSAAAAVLTAAASCSSAVRLSATFWKAVSTVDLYWAADCS